MIYNENGIILLEYQNEIINSSEDIFMYKYETHLHTSESSSCAECTGAEMAEKYKAEGYTGIIVTDHFSKSNDIIPLTLSWKERIEIFCVGYENAKRKGDEIGLDVFFGFEYGNDNSHFLVYGLNKDWLIKNENILNMELTDFLEYTRSCGGMVVQAHPFRERDYIRSTTHAPRFVDAIEAVNKSQDSIFNDRAKIYAEWYNLPVTSGSDSHNITNRWFNGGVLSERKFNSALEYMNAVVNGKVTMIE